MFVKQYWAIIDCLPQGMEHRQRIVPNGLMDLTFYLGTRPKPADKQRNLPENTILNGQLKVYYDLVVTGKLSMFSVTFQPHGVNMFFNVPAGEFFNHHVPLKYLVNDATVELETRLYEAGSFREQTCIVEGFLLKQLRKNCREYEMKRIAHSISLINSSGGLISIDALASAACLSRKQFERIFLACIGTTPRQFLKTVRFQHSLHTKSLNPGMPLTEIAYTCGYYDQSHMISDYRLLAGKTPTQYFAECDPVSDYFF
jgi:AraC-like DNA-binding protein